jgi:hypothetical protein
MRPDKPLATLREAFPVELRASRAIHELKLDDRSKLTFTPLRAGGLAIQCWRPGTDRYGHGLLLSGSIFLTEQEVAVLMNALQWKEKTQ